jgi:hypothetical protein
MQTDPFMTTILASNRLLLSYLCHREKTRKKRLQKFRENGAIDSHHAVVLEEASGADLSLFHSLLSRGIMRKTQAERYDLDEAAASRRLPVFWKKGARIGWAPGTRMRNTEPAAGRSWLCSPLPREKPFVENAPKPPEPEP